MHTLSKMKSVSNFQAKPNQFRVSFFSSKVDHTAYCSFTCWNDSTNTVRRSPTQRLHTFIYTNGFHCSRKNTKRVKKIAEFDKTYHSHTSCTFSIGRQTSVLSEHCLQNKPVCVYTEKSVCIEHNVDDALFQHSLHFCCCCCTILLSLAFIATHHSIVIGKP